jgi:DNA polymerase-1
VPQQLATVEELLAALRRHGVVRGSFLALSLAEGRGDPGIGVAEPSGGQWALATSQPAAAVAGLETEFRPRWVWWSQQTPLDLARAGVRVATCWDLVAVHRLIFGGWRSDPALIWAALHDLDPDSMPGTGQLDLFGGAGDEGTDPEDPVRPDGHLRPEWAGGGWARDPRRLARWAWTALRASMLQQQRLAAAPAAGDVAATARSESAAELLCAELTVDGLPIDLARAEQIIASFAGPRPRDAAEAAAARERRDGAVLRLVPNTQDIDLRNPAQVRTLLARVGIDVPNTRSWRLERFSGAHPVVEALLVWRKAERIATTFGYEWLARNVGPDARLRGAWSGSDGAAGRMTAQAGLHNLPADLRPAVAAPAGHVLVRADLGQIEPRVLAAISGDRALARATQDDDLYAPVASRLDVERPVAKLAVLAAMYGQTSGAAGQALQAMDSAYPVAMRYLREAYEAGHAGRPVRTYGGRLVRMWQTPAGLDAEQERATLASRGRFARNAVVQGAAAELFKAWAVTVRARGLAWQARVVLCLHDELLVQAPVEHGPAVQRLLTDCLAEAAARWAPDGSVRFVADVSVLERWSQAKD